MRTAQHSPSRSGEGCASGAQPSFYGGGRVTRFVALAPCVGGIGAVSGLYIEQACFVIMHTHLENENDIRRRRRWCSANWRRPDVAVTRRFADHVLLLCVGASTPLGGEEGEGGLGGLRPD